MFGLISCRGTGFTGLLFITRIVALSVFPDHRLCRFSISSRHILCRQIRVSRLNISRSPLCRFAKISGHHAISQSSFISGQKISTGLCLVSLLSCISIRHINQELSIIPDHQLCNSIKYQSIMVSHLTGCYVLRVSQFIL